MCLKSLVFRQFVQQFAQAYDKENNDSSVLLALCGVESMTNGFPKIIEAEWRIYASVN